MLQMDQHLQKKAINLLDGKMEMAMYMHQIAHL